MRLSDGLFAALDREARENFHRRMTIEYQAAYPDTPGEVVETIRDDIREYGREWGASHTQTFRSLYYISFEIGASILRDPDFQQVISAEPPMDRAEIIDAIAAKLEREAELI